MYIRFLLLALLYVASRSKAIDSSANSQNSDSAFVGIVDPLAHNLALIEQARKMIESLENYNEVWNSLTVDNLITSLYIENAMMCMDPMKFCIKNNMIYDPVVRELFGEKNMLESTIECIRHLDTSCFDGHDDPKKYASVMGISPSSFFPQCVTEENDNLAINSIEQNP